MLRVSISITDFHTSIQEKGHFMRKYKSKNGFTLSELLIVVAIIAVLVAVAVPVFISQLNKSRLAADHAMMRNAYAIVQMANIQEEIEIDGVTKSFDQITDKTVCVLSSDCKLLTLENPSILPEGSYQLQANGRNDEGDPCPECNILPWNIDESIGMPMSLSHIKGSPIYISYRADVKMFCLGLIFS